MRALERALALAADPRVQQIADSNDRAMMLGLLTIAEVVSEAIDDGVRQMNERYRETQAVMAEQLQILRRAHAPAAAAEQATESLRVWVPAWSPQVGDRVTPSRRGQDAMPGLRGGVVTGVISAGVIDVLVDGFEAPQQYNAALWSKFA